MGAWSCRGLQVDVVCSNEDSPAIRAEAPPDSEFCKYIQQADLRGPGIDLEAIEAFNAEECCSICQSIPQCQFFTFSATAGICYPKHSHGTEVPNHLLVSGSLVTAAG